LRIGEVGGLGRSSREYLLRLKSPGLGELATFPRSSSVSSSSVSVLSSSPVVNVDVKLLRLSAVKLGVSERFVVAFEGFREEEL